MWGEERHWIGSMWTKRDLFEQLLVAIRWLQNFGNVCCCSARITFFFVHEVCFWIFWVSFWGMYYQCHAGTEARSCFLSIQSLRASTLVVKSIRLTSEQKSQTAQWQPSDLEQHIFRAASQPPLSVCLQPSSFVEEDWIGNCILLPLHSSLGQQAFVFGKRPVKVDEHSFSASRPTARPSCVWRIAVVVVVFQTVYLFNDDI